MRLSFRQGIVQCPPNFLELENGAVNLVVPSSESIIVTFADGDSNYVLSERLDVEKAWPGPFPTGNQSFWLYWDLDLLTGAKTYGYTILEPIESAAPPRNPQDQQHWYNISLNKMYVWSASGNKWQPRVRVFAAQLTGNGLFISMSNSSPSFTGTQTGVTISSLYGSPAFTAGALVFDADGKVLKRSNGTFFTSEDIAVTGVASSSQVKYGAMLIEAEATDNIPKFSIVQFTDFNKITTANNELITEAPYGITNQDAAVGDIVSVMMEGIITNPFWDWSSLGVNAPLYLDTNGQLTGQRPTVPVIIGYVIDRDVILINHGGGSGESSGGGDIPEIGGPNQVLGVNALGDGLEYKTLAGKDGIVIQHSAARIDIGISVIDCGTF